MDEFIKELDPNLDYLEHKIIGNEVIIYVASNRKICRCPYCGSESARIHSRYEKSFQDLPIMARPNFPDIPICYQAQNLKQN